MPLGAYSDVIPYDSLFKESFLQIIYTTFMVDKKHKEYLKFIGVMLFIVTVTVLMCRFFSDERGPEHFLRNFMGVFSVTFASFKLIGYKMFVVMFRTYDIIAKRVSWYSNLFPFIQLGLGLVFLLDVLPVYRSVAMLLFAGISSIGVFNEVRERRAGKIHCACLGNVIKLPLSTVSFVEDVGMFMLALVMILL